MTHLTFPSLLLPLHQNSGSSAVDSGIVPRLPKGSVAFGLELELLSAPLGMGFLDWG